MHKSTKNLVLKINIVFLSLLLPFSAQGFQKSNDNYQVKNQVNYFINKKKPIVAIDEAHHNFHTMNGRYHAFSKVIKSAGFNVKPNKKLFTNNSLKNIDILVISNALHKKNVNNWNSPNFSAFNEHEINAVEQWVKEGGSLFLIADHMPFPEAAKNIAEKFGFIFNNGYVFDKKIANNYIHLTIIYLNNT